MGEREQFDETDLDVTRALQRLEENEKTEGAYFTPGQVSDDIYRDLLKYGQFLKEVDKKSVAGRLERLAREGVVEAETRIVFGGFPFGAPIAVYRLKQNPNEEGSD